MENTDIPQFRTYRGEIELEGVVIQVDIFYNNKNYYENANAST